MSAAPGRLHGQAPRTRLDNVIKVFALSFPVLQKSRHCPLAHCRVVTTDSRDLARHIGECHADSLIELGSASIDALIYERNKRGSRSIPVYEFEELLDKHGKAWNRGDLKRFGSELLAAVGARIYEDGAAGQVDR